MSVNFSNLTAKQKKVYTVIESYISRNGIPPTVREIGELVGEKTPGAVQGILNRLEQKGAIKRQIGAARSIQLVSSDNEMYASPEFVPEIKKINARNIDDIANIYNIEKYHPVSPDALSEGGHYFMIRCPDDGLAESGYSSRDFIFVNTSADLKDGDIVLIFYNSRSLLRYYHKEENGTLTLKADYSIIEKESFTKDEVRIIGKVEARFTKL